MTSNYQVTPLQQVVGEDTANRTHEDQPFEERLEQALTDENMHGALERFALPGVQPAEQFLLLRRPIMVLTIALRT